MRCALLDYPLPEDQIARRPTEAREAARLLVVDPSEREAFDHRHIGDLAELIPAGALLVVNDTRVVPARLLGKKAGSGGAVELLLVRALAVSAGAGTEGAGAGTEGDGARIVSAGARPEATPTSATTVSYLAMGRSSKTLRDGTLLVFGDGALTARIEGRDEASRLFVVTLAAPDGDVAAAIEKVGHVPLPPYLHRPDDAADRERYQTVFARVPGAIAAPTAGLHLSQALLDRLTERGVERAAVTLHVGLGTFQPVVAEDLDQHPMHSEQLVVGAEAREAIARARARGAPVVAVGTTVVRALESAADPERAGHVREAQGETRLLIQPGYSFRVVDRLLTNFHLPRSTLLALVYAFGGSERVRRAYEVAVAEGYRFFSYGDAMLLQRSA